MVREQDSLVTWDTGPGPQTDDGGDGIWGPGMQGHPESVAEADAIH